MGIPKGDPAVLLRQIVRPGDVVVDVGASDGSVTIAAATLTGPTGRVLAFEPDGRYEGWLAILATYPMVEYFPIALSDRAGTVTLHHAPSRQQSSVHPGAVSKGIVASVDVRATCLDALDGPIDVVKIDTQGHEVAIVLGGQKWLNGATRWIVEVWPHGLAAAGTSARDLCDLFWAAGYDVLWADGARVTSDALADWLQHVDQGFCNVLALPKVA